MEEVGCPGVLGKTEVRKFQNLWFNQLTFFSKIDEQGLDRGPQGGETGWRTAASPLPTSPEAGS